MLCRRTLIRSSADANVVAHDAPRRESSPGGSYGRRSLGHQFGAVLFSNHVGPAALPSRSMSAPCAMENVSDLSEGGRCRIVWASGPEWKLSGHGCCDPASGVGFEQPRIDEIGGTYAGLVEYSHRHLLSEVDGIGGMIQTTGKPDQVLLARQLLSASIVEMRVGLGQVARSRSTCLLYTSRCV